MTDTLISFAAVQQLAVQRREPGRPGARRRAGPRPGRGAADPAEGRRAWRCWAPTGTWSTALRDALLERHELVGHEITDVLEAAREAHQAGAAGRVAVTLAGERPRRAAPRAAEVIDLRESADDHA